MIRNGDGPRACLPVEVVGREFEPLYRSLQRAGAAAASVVPGTSESVAVPPFASPTHSFAVPQAPRAPRRRASGFAKAGEPAAPKRRRPPERVGGPSARRRPPARSGALPICPRPRTRRPPARAPLSGRFSGGAGGAAVGAILGTCGSHNGPWVLGGETD